MVVMKFISFLFCVFLFFSCDRRGRSVSDFPPYKLIIDFSENLKKETGLVLCCYGINVGHKPHNVRYGVANFDLSYNLFKDRKDMVTLEAARQVLVFSVEKFLNEINSNENIRSELDVFPFVSDSVNLCVYFMDENKIELGDGVACVSIFNGSVRYERYDIEEYREVYPAIGKHSIIHQESYQDALDIVKGNVHAEQFQNQK